MEAESSPRGGRCGYHGPVKRIRDSGYRAFHLDVELPPSGARRYLVIAWLVLGALVALFVPVALAVVIWGMATGQDQRPVEPAERTPSHAPAPVTDETPRTR